MKDVHLTGQSREQIAYHVQLLAEGGMIEAEDLSSHDGYDWRPIRLTFEGHEFLDTVRDGAVWRNTKKLTAETGTMSVKFLFEVGKVVAKQELAKHGIHQ